MPTNNQLVLPPKVSCSVSFGPNIRRYIQENLSDTHPDAFRTDIDRLDKLRSDALDGIGDRCSSKVEALQTYALHLVYLMKKLPPSLPPPLPFSPPFPPSSFALSASAPPEFENMQWELCNVLWNLAAAWSARAGEEERRAAEGIGRAKKALESSAGALHTLRLMQLPILYSALGQTRAAQLPPDMKQSWLEAVEHLMLAQAQECFWQAGVSGGNLKNPTVAKLALSVAELYDSAYDTIAFASPPISDTFPTSWLSHIETKRNHFHAAAQYRQSGADSEAHKHGEEIARLLVAGNYVRKGLEHARRGISPSVVNDLRSLDHVIKETLTRTQRDNDLIYHQDVPAPSVLPALQARTVVSPSGIHGLNDPRKVLGQQVLFDKLVPWAVTRAVYVYEERKKDWLQEEIYSQDEELEQVAARALQALNLPAALDALERPIGLPPSLLGKAQEVRNAGGVSRVHALFADVSKLAASNSKLLDDAFDILDIEASEDEALRSSHPHLSRLPSHEANQTLIEQATRYTKLMEEARSSDAQVLEKWEEWEDKVDNLGKSEEELEAYVPASTYPSSRTDKSSNPSLTHSRRLRVMLESLDDIRDARKRLLVRVKHAAATDDIKRLVAREAESVALEDLKPEMFEGLIQGELEKFESYKDELYEHSERQSAQLDVIREEHVLFVESRRNDAAVKARERALQELDLAYHRYSEVLSNLTEGLNFYNGMARYLNDLRENCKVWVRERRAEADRLTLPHQLQTAQMTSPTSPYAVNGFSNRPTQAPVASPPVSPAVARLPRHSFGLPPPDSEEWEEAAPLPPPPRTRGDVDLPAPDSAIWEELPPLPPPVSTQSKGPSNRNQRTKVTGRNAY